ncbi:MAG: cysteine--tRNA ligase [Lachnospiraceae bacterium]|nr:cysteine--tRNA ligase [Lachnospiraceae bacterium]
MKIFNTLSRRKEEFVPLEPGKVKMYVCGPTVYNFIHIGNARPMIVFDTVRRYFEYKGYEVNYVSNFTDVDDKIIKKAMEEGVESEVISRRYIEECKKDMAGMNVKPATTHPQATREIAGMLEMIRTLIDKGHAYAAADGTVYFRTGSFKDYGKLSHKNLDELQSGFREIKVTGEEGKEDPSDFVLWKPKKEGEPYWESDWCQGRPGWHIECSVMAKKYLGEQIDIHAGGEDLIFPHHENEIAQSEAANGKPFATYWMHNAFLNIDTNGHVQKMSKSLGNFFTVREISERYDLQVLRFFMLSAHYRSPLNFSADLMEASKNGLDRILTAAERLRDAGNAAAAQGPDAEEGKLLSQEEAHRTAALELARKFEAAMEDDFNTADAVAAVFELVKLSNSTVSDDSSRAYIKFMEELLGKLCDVLGILTERKAEVLDEEIEAMIEARQQARKAKNFALADEIRGKLLEMGIVLEDTREGVKWKRA